MGRLTAASPAITYTYGGIISRIPFKVVTKIAAIPMEMPPPNRPIAAFTI
jgi:hypothetical protein